MSEVPELAGGYYLERTPNVLILRRIDGSLAAAFSSRGVSPEAIRWAAEEAGQGGAFAGGREGHGRPRHPSGGMTLCPETQALWTSILKDGRSFAKDVADKERSLEALEPEMA